MEPIITSDNPQPTVTWSLNPAPPAFGKTLEKSRLENSGVPSVVIVCVHRLNAIGSSPAGVALCANSWLQLTSHGTNNEVTAQQNTYQRRTMTARPTSPHWLIQVASFRDRMESDSAWILRDEEVTPPQCRFPQQVLEAQSIR